jgi:radical SAM superfamily enzyme YgiQ (UPF0313 family)
VVRVGLVQINNSFSGQSYLPLAVGMLQAYAQRYLQRPEAYEFLPPVYSRRPVGDIVEELAGADVILVSVYVWNMRISLEVARALKARRPDVLIVFGGPQVPDRDENFLRMYPFVDVACHGEGEQTALALLEQVATHDWSVVPSISYLDADGRLVRTPRGGRARDLALFPSPYLENVFAPLMAAHPEEHWIGLWETNRGCPFSCTFCDWGSATASKVYTFDIERLQREVQWFADHRIEYVFCCDANFGLLPRDVELATIIAATKRARGYPHALSVQATKNATERAYQTQKILADAGLNKGVDIALQSIDPRTLKSIKRDNISTNTYQELQRRFTRDRIETYTDLILGLPGETYDSFATAVSTLIQNGQHNRIQFNNLSILPNAEMGDPEYQRRHGLVTIETNTINIHGSIGESAEGITETQQLVIATGAMPKEAWVETRTYAWLAAFLYFDKILQIPLLLVHEQCGVGYRELFERFARVDDDRYPTLASIHRFLRDKARDIQQGGPEYCLSDRWLPIWWPADEYLLIQLSVDGKLHAFYDEAERLLQEVAAGAATPIAPRLLHDAVRLNEQLLKQPFQSADAAVDLSHNIWEYYRSIVVGEPMPLERRSVRYRIDRTSKTWSAWDEWCREVVWWGNKKGAYLYSNNAVEAQLSGHF